MKDSLKERTISGMLWTAVQRFGRMGIMFVGNLVLARLLSPEDFGYIGMLMVFIAIANTFVDSGFGAALIQRKEPTQTDYSTIFYWNLIVAFFFCGVFYPKSVIRISQCCMAMRNPLISPRWTGKTALFLKTLPDRGYACPLFCPNKPALRLTRIG